MIAASLAAVSGVAAASLGANCLIMSAASSADPAIAVAQLSKHAPKAKIPSFRMTHAPVGFDFTNFEGSKKGGVAMAPAIAPRRLRFAGGARPNHIDIGGDDQVALPHAASQVSR
jgi:hypothetical protein